MILLDFDSFISATPSMIDFGGTLTPPLGGSAQRLNRLGSRYAITYAVDFDTDEEFRRFAQRLRRAKREGARVRFPQVGIAIGAPSSPLVDGATAGGTSLPLKELSPYYAVREGQFLSIIVDGQRYVHSVDAEAIANADGEVELTITPELRISLVGDEEVEMAVVYIEGLLDGDEVQWEHAANSHEPLIFTVREMA
jgi:hypothetical protein